MLTGLEVIPVSTLLTLIAGQVLEVAIAAKDVLIEKESFRKLSRYLEDIEPVLRELNERCFKDLTAAKQALSSLKSDLSSAHTLVKACQDKSRFYLLVNCRNIVKDAQRVTRDIGKDLELLSLAGTELSLDVRDNLCRVKEQFMCAEYQASEARLEILERLETGIREHRTDQGFANDLIISIAKAVGIPVEASHISDELSSFKKEKEYLAEKKARQEAAFMEQVLQLLTQADARYTSEVCRQNFQMLEGKHGVEGEPMEPLPSFICPLRQELMVDPVTASSNQTYEREAIELWFKEGNTTDPTTHADLKNDFSLRPNTLLKKSIQEWKDMNYCIRIRKAKRLLEGEDDRDMDRALDDLSLLCQESSMNTDWIGAGGTIRSIVAALGVHDKQIQGKALVVLQTLVQNNVRNADEVVECGGLGLVVRCLGKQALRQSAAQLLLGLLQSNPAASDKLCDEKSAILYLVMLQNDEDENARRILEQLCDKDANIVHMAKMAFFEPLIDRMLEGSEKSKLVMAQALASIELPSEENVVMLGEKGVIPPLLGMVESGNVETKAAALEALRNLSSNALNQQLIARAKGFSILMLELASPRSPQSSREYAAIILRNLATGCNDDGSLFAGSGINNVKQTVETLLGILLSPYNVSTRAQVLQVLLGMSVSAEGAQVRKLIRCAQGGIAFLLESLDGTKRELRDSAAVLLSCLSSDGGAAVSKCFLESEKLGLLVQLLSGSITAEVRSAAATILANFPADKATTRSLQEAGAVNALLKATISSESQEAALAALLRFTDSGEQELQIELAAAGVHSLLVDVLRSSSSSSSSKAAAATALRNLSLATLDLSSPPESSGCCSFFVGSLSQKKQQQCRAHQGVCSVRSTLCIVQAGAVPGLISLLDEQPASQACEAGVRALSTLVTPDNCTAEKGCAYLHEAGAVSRVIALLQQQQGSKGSKLEAISFLEDVFLSKKMRDLYRSEARIPLTAVASHGSIKPKATRLLGKLDLIPEMSMSTSNIS